MRTPDEILADLDRAAALRRAADALADWADRLSDCTTPDRCTCGDAWSDWDRAARMAGLL